MNGRAGVITHQTTCESRFSVLPLPLDQNQNYPLLSRERAQLRGRGKTVDQYSVSPECVRRAASRMEKTKNKINTKFKHLSVCK